MHPLSIMQSCPDTPPSLWISWKNPNPAKWKEGLHQQEGEVCCCKMQPAHMLEQARSCIASLLSQGSDVSREQSAQRYRSGLARVHISSDGYSGCLQMARHVLSGESELAHQTQNAFRDSLCETHANRFSTRASFTSTGTCWAQLQQRYETSKLMRHPSLYAQTSHTSFRQVTALPGTVMMQGLAACLQHF